jgi:hypothetical protein
MVPSDSPALWMFASSCIQLVLLHLMMGQVYSFSGKKEDVSFLITKPKAKCRSQERYLQRTPVPPAIEGAWIDVADFFDWHGRPRMWISKSISSSVHQFMMPWSTTLPMRRLRMFYLSGVQAGDGAALLKKLRSAEGSTRQQVLNRNGATY